MSNLNRTLETAGTWLSRVQTGCIAVLVNLFLMAFCLWGVYAAYIGWQLETKGEITTGTVVRMEESDSAEGGCCVYSPVIEFQAAGQAYTFDSENASYPPAYKVGQQVRVRYDPTNPNTAQIDSIFERWLLPVILIPAMLLTALVVNYFLVRAFLRGEDMSS